MSRNLNAISGNGQAFAVLPDLTIAPRGEVLQTVERIGQLLTSCQLRATMQLRLMDSAAHTSYFKLVLEGEQATASTKPTDKPDLELIMTPETWWEIASGRLAPHAAFFSGRMRVRGSVNLAQNLLKHVAASGGRTHLCSGDE